MTALLLLLSAAAVAGPDPFDRPPGEPLHVSTYVESTADQSVELTAREWRVTGGLYLESLSSTGDRHVVIVDGALQTLAWRFESGDGSTRIDAAREHPPQGPPAPGAGGGTPGVRLAGLVRGEPVGGAVMLGDYVWIQSIERSLRRFILAGEPGDRLRFSVVQPDNLSARTLQARVMGDEAVLVDGLSIPARRVRISLPGIGAIIWSSDYWFRLPDGLFVQSRVTRGPPGTPETVVRLTGDSGPAPE